MSFSDCVSREKDVVFSFCAARGVSALYCDNVYFVVYIDQDASSLRLLFILSRMTTPHTMVQISR